MLWGFDSVSLCSSAMWDEDSIYPRIKAGYASTSDMIKKLVENFNTVNFTQGSAILKTE